MTEQPFRTESDTMGSVRIPADTLYGPQTQRALNNFTISRQPLPWIFIEALLRIKHVAAATNVELDRLDPEIGTAIIQATGQLLSGQFRDQFPVSVFQTGSGTSTNMNVNEVIATVATSAITSIENKISISANDHVNLGQSSNDVIPSALHISAVDAVTNTLQPALQQLADTIRKQANKHPALVKTGRTHLMDALPIRFQAELEAWAVLLDECSERLSTAIPRLSRLALGGTAVGSGVNCHPDFPEKAITRLNELTGHSFTPAKSLYKALSSLDTIVELSGHLKTIAISLTKIANDLRWMNSGPLAGLGEITLPALQPGSSIMPAKVNPVIPEAVCMAAAQVIGYDTAIGLAGQAGNFQLNTMLPLAAANIHESIDLLTGSCNSLGELAIADMQVNSEACTAALARNPILVTALTPEIGYQRAAELAKIAAKEDRPILDIAAEHTDIPLKKLQHLLDPHHLAGNG